VAGHDFTFKNICYVLHVPVESPAEAMACGCAVATTDCGGNRDYAEHEKTALVSDPDDFESLVDNVLRLLSDEELSVTLALAGRDRIAEFTWEKSTRRLIEVLNRHS
jgi:glycosyltransferase involved in cell wall biosynthesis